MAPWYRLILFTFLLFAIFEANVNGQTTDDGMFSLPDDTTMDDETATNNPGTEVGTSNAQTAISSNTASPAPVNQNTVTQPIAIQNENETMVIQLVGTQSSDNSAGGDSDNSVSVVDDGDSGCSKLFFSAHLVVATITSSVFLLF